MKKIKGSSISISAGLVFIIINIILILYLLNKNISFGTGIIYFLIINVINYLSFIEKHYFFEYDNEFFIIKNSWIFYHKQYSIGEIDKIKITISTYMGHAIKIYFIDGRKKTFPNNITKLKLEEMIKNIEKIKKEIENSK